MVTRSSPSGGSSAPRTVQLSGVGYGTATVLVIRVDDRFLIMLLAIGLIPAIATGPLGFFAPPWPVLVIGAAVALGTLWLAPRLAFRVYTQTPVGADHGFLPPWVRRLLVWFRMPPKLRNRLG